MPRMNPNINYGLWMKRMCQCWFTICNKCTTLVRMSIVGEGVLVWGQGVCGNSILSEQFCCEPKTSTK